MTTFDIDEIERLLAAAEEDLIWEDQVLRKLDLAHAVMDHFPAMIAELRELREANARLREIVRLIAGFDARNSIVHLRDIARAALGEPQ